MQVKVETRKQQNGVLVFGNEAFMGRLTLFIYPMSLDISVATSELASGCQGMMVLVLCFGPL